MTHPLEQLAPYVDGSLGPAERAEVDEHLRGCAPCRGEVAAAGRAREALGAMPEPTPIDLTDRFAPERVQEMRPPRQAAGRRPSWSKLAPALAAAAVVALVALVVPRIGGSSDDPQTAADAEGAPGEAASGAEGPLRLRFDPTDYDEERLGEAAASYAAAIQPASPATDGTLGDAGASEVAATAAPSATELRAGGRKPTDRALACLQQAFPGYPGRIVEVRRATFDGEPAYLAFVVEGPGVGEPADAVTIWVASAEDCSIVTLTSSRV